MTTGFMKAVEQCSVAALASGDLLPIQTEQTDVLDQGLQFVVRWVSTQAAKDAINVAMPGGPRDPDFNPFLNPDPALLIGPVGDHHLAILNKFPVCANHIVLACREFQEQLSPLALDDFSALATVMSSDGGLGFYNGGPEAGASQRHKHLQWLPTVKGNASLQYLVAGFPSDTPEHGALSHPLLAFKHVFVKTQCGLGVSVATSAASIHRAFELACATLGLGINEQGLLPPCSLLIEQGWLLLVPRRREHVGDVSVNALSYGGTLYVRRPEQVEPVRERGPLAILAQAAIV